VNVFSRARRCIELHATAEKRNGLWRDGRSSLVNWIYRVISYNRIFCLTRAFLLASRISCNLFSSFLSSTYPRTSPTIYVCVPFRVLHTPIPSHRSPKRRVDTTYTPEFACVTYKWRGEPSSVSSSFSSFSQVLRLLWQLRLLSQVPAPPRSLLHFSCKYETISSGYADIRLVCIAN
jgi:hypothetical protein